ncbi:ABC transporter ATP-binding protein [Dongia sedimenti]|uniref:ABC transporter ATP-binding protein n=1 Tax=Dongia sedimenti TaxID=3064282 RepID=A0ABU0YHR3_9PROT|nr:ABC transporter ATP-binding protein [Rhodospirillaceae bacterium R-7]
MSYVEIRGLSKRFDDASVFEKIDFEVERGEMCVLVGPSGCGKTTLLRAIAGLVDPDEGRIAIDGREITALPPKARGIGMVMQQYALFPNMNVEQNLSFGLEQQKVPAAEIRRRVAAMVALVGLEARAKARPHALSGGQKQRVALARALVLEPKLLLLDEPMSALDAQIRKRLRDELKRLQREIGFTAIMVTHDQEEALVLGDRIAVMQAGRLSQVGSPHKVYGAPASAEVASFIGDFNILVPAAIERVFHHRPERSWAIHPGAFEVVGFRHLNGSVSLAPERGFEADATVAGMQMLGPVIRYHLQADTIALKMDVLNKPSHGPLAPGSPLRIRLAAADVREI